MTILFDSARPVKSARRDFAPAFAPTRERRMPFTQADLDWAAQTFNGGAADSDAIPSDADLDFAAGCAMAQALMDAGYSLF